MPMTRFFSFSSSKMPRVNHFIDIYNPTNFPRHKSNTFNVNPGTCLWMSFTLRILWALPGWHQQPRKIVSWWRPSPNPRKVYLSLNINTVNMYNRKVERSCHRLNKHFEQGASQRHRKTPKQRVIRRIVLFKSTTGNWVFRPSDIMWPAYLPTHMD